MSIIEIILIALFLTAVVGYYFLVVLAVIFGAIRTKQEFLYVIFPFYAIVKIFYKRVKDLK